MKISCKCLNVTIESKGSTFDDIDISNLDLPRNDFFNEGIGTIELVGITKEQPLLMEVCNVGAWVVHRCLNCLVYTHALHREKGAVSILVNKALISDPTVILSLTKSDSYSPVFRIVINYTEDDDVFTKVSGTGRNQAGIAVLHQQLSSFIQKESAQTEERVRAYSDQQYAMLENLRTRAHRDHRSLTKLLSEIGLQDQPVAQAQKTLTVDNEPALPFEASNPIVLASASAAIKKPNVSVAGSGRPRVREGTSRRLSESSQSNISFDSEVLFPLEGMDDPTSDNYHTDEEHSDTDESGSHDEGIHIPRRVGSFVYAKSLPVDVPTFVTQRRGHEETTFGLETHEEIPNEQHYRSPRQPMDIAASIKALAKSVHGDAVFGDLPRPRFSSKM